MSVLTLNGLKAAEVPFVVQGPGVNTADFKVTVFASGLDFPNGIAELTDGSLIVTASDGSPSYFSGSGRLIRLVDSDGDGSADGTPDVLYSGLAPTLTAVCTRSDLVFTTGNGTPLYIFRTDTDPSDTLSLVGQIDFDYSASRNYHSHSGLTLRKSPGFENRYDLFFQIGGEENFAESTDLVPISSGNVINVSGSLARAAAHMMTLQDQGTHFEMVSVVQLASGLRNASGFTIHPSFGDLWFHENGIDGLVDSNEPHSADELNSIRFAEIGNGIHDFGFPDNYTAYRTDTVVGGEGIQPVITFQPYGNPQTGLRSEGPNGITFAPPGFPRGLNGGLFIGFHGKLFRGGLANDENPVVYADPETGDYFHFIKGQQTGIGHLIGLHASSDSLYVADVTTGGALLDGAGEGCVYKIESLAPVLNAPYRAWTGGTFTNPFNETDPEDNPDGDTLVNLLEFAFGTDPTSADVSALTWIDPVIIPGTPVVAHALPGEGTDYVARFLRRTDGSVSYAWRFSSDLTDWECSTDAPSWYVTPTPIAMTIDHELVEVPYPFLLDNGREARFFQVAVGLAP